MRRVALLPLILLAVGVFPLAAAAQQYTSLVGWTKAGEAVVYDEANDVNVRCVARPWKAALMAPQQGCVECKSRKACAVEEKATAATATADGSYRAEPSPDHHGVLVLTPKEGAPTKLPLRAGRDAKVTTYFRADGKALAIHVSAAEQWIFVVDLTAR